MIRRAAGAACLAAAVTACGHPVFKPPTGPGVATDASAAWAAATSSCRSATSYTARLRVLRLSVESAITRDQIYLNATHSGQGIFVLAGSTTDAVLWLKREHRVVKAPAGDIIDAILGLQVSPDRLLALLTGCVTRAYDISSAASYGKRIAVQTSDARVYLDSEQQASKVIAGEAEGFIVELSWKASTVPVKMWLNSLPGREPRASLTVSVEDATVNPAIPATFFAPPAGAATAEPMTLEELRTGSWRK